MNEQKQTLRLGAAVLMDLPEADGDTRQWWTEHHRERQQVLSAFSRIPSPDLTTWKVLTVDQAITGHQTTIRRRLQEDARIFVQNGINSYLSDLEWHVGQPTGVDLVRTTAGALGFVRTVPLKEFYNVAREYGLYPCPPWVVLQLRIRYEGQPIAETIVVATEWTALYHLSNHGGRLWIEKHDEIEAVHRLNVLWVFSRPHPVKA